MLLLAERTPAAKLIEAQLQAAGADHVAHVVTLDAFLEQLCERGFALIIAELAGSAFDGRAALAAARGVLAEVPFVFLGAAVGDELFAELLRGGATDCLSTASPMRLSASLGNVVRSAQLLGERRAVEAALAESERMFRTLIGNMPGMAFRCVPAPPWSFDYASPGALELSGYAPEDFYAGGVITWAELMHPDDVDRVARIADEAFAARRQLTVTYRIRTRSGEEKWVWDRSVGVYAEDGSLLALEGFVSDVTEAHRRAELEQTLIGIVSHDLRNPLNTIVLGAELALRSPRLDDEVRRWILKIRDAGQSAGRLTHDLLDFTLARRGDLLRLQLRPVDLRTVIAQVVDDAQLAHADRIFLVDHEGDPTGVWDPERLAQALGNLVGNAVTYSPPTTPILLSTRTDEATITLAVDNEGPPIPAEMLPRLFEPFHRGTSADSGRRSVGLGLYIVEQVVRAHGGRIEAASALGRTSFTITLPRESGATSGDVLRVGAAGATEAR